MQRFPSKIIIEDIYPALRVPDSAGLGTEKGQPHVIRTLAGAGAARLFDQFDPARQGRCAK